jgi:hypothetical protein
MKHEFTPYKFRWITVNRGTRPEAVCLIAVPHYKNDKSGFVVYATDKPEAFHPIHNRPLIGALLFDTEDQAIDAGEYVLRERNQSRG